MSGHLRIGELARRTGKSIHALRYYESRGLMPFVSRDPGGRRRYDDQHVEWLFLLDRLQRTGMSLAQMQAYATLVARGRHTIDARIALLEEHLRTIEQQMDELARSKSLLIAKLAFYREWQANGKRPSASWMQAAPEPTPAMLERPPRLARARRMQGGK